MSALHDMAARRFARVKQLATGLEGPEVKVSAKQLGTAYERFWLKRGLTPPNYSPANAARKRRAWR